MREQAENKPLVSLQIEKKHHYNRIITLRGEYSGFMLFLFLLMAAYMVLPLVDVPLMGLSLSAPVFFLIALQAIFRPPEPWLSRFRGWILLAGVIWLGIFIATVGNGLRSNGVKIDRGGWISVIQYAYWLLVFVITAYFVSRKNMLERVSSVLGWAVFGLALARLFEVIAWGKIGAWTETQLLTQNNYGFIFSMFFPFLLAPIITTKGSARLLMILRVLITGMAVLINGSRGSWIGVSAGIFIFCLLFVLAQPKKIGWSILIIGLAAVIFFTIQLAPSKIALAFGKRFATFQTIQEDKSFAIRELMIQKGLQLFRESPLIGVGISRFTKESVQLYIPKLLAYAPQSHFDVKSAHNSYIAFLAETGLVGSLPFAILLVILAIDGLKASLKLVRKKQVYALSVFSAFIGMSIHMWSINSISNSANWFIYGLVAGIIVLEGKATTAEKPWD